MSEATCVEEETDPSTSRKMTSSAVRASPGRFNEASFAIAVKRSRCDTERSSPGRSIAVSTASQKK